MSFEEFEKKIGKPATPFIPPGKYNFKPHENDTIEIVEASVMDDIHIATFWWGIFECLDDLGDRSAGIPATIQ